MARGFWCKGFDLQRLIASTTVHPRSRKSSRFALRRGDILDTITRGFAVTRDQLG